MSSSAVQVSSEPPRRNLTDRQAQTVHGLCEAAVDELAVVGIHGLTVRSVAKRAGVAPATAYTYFASKEHLVAEVFWRRVSTQRERVFAPDATPASRAAAVLADAALVVADEAPLASACTVALLVDDVEVAELRARIGRELHRRLVDAIGTEATPPQLRTLELALSGALLQVGTGHLDYETLPIVLTDAAHAVLDT